MTNRIVEPPHATKIWRYMDFVKFTALLASRSLFFTRGDKFEDPFEGASGTLATRTKWQKMYLEHVRELASPTAAIGTGNRPTKYEREQLDDLRRINSWKRRRFFISCWFESDHESDAMWKLYSRDQSQGIAIATTVGRLIRATGDRGDIEIGRVNYLDYSKDVAPIGDAFFFKRVEFQHEKELRAVLEAYEEAEDEVVGRPVPVKLESLVKSVHISPFAPDWFLSLVEETMGAFHLKRPVIRSRHMTVDFL